MSFSPSSSQPSRPASISPSEWEVANVVWDREPISGPIIVAELSERLEWHPKTVGTYLNRLVQKGVLIAEKAGRANIYSAAISRSACLAEESNSFLHRVFRGATKPLLAHFAERGNLTDDEIEELQQLLDAQRQANNNFKQEEQP